MVTQEGPNSHLRSNGNCLYNNQPCGYLVTRHKCWKKILALPLCLSCSNLLQYKSCPRLMYYALQDGNWQRILLLSHNFLTMSLINRYWSCFWMLIYYPTVINYAVNVLTSVWNRWKWACEYFIRVGKNLSNFFYFWILSDL